jgi:hypothetical protein
MTHTYAVLELSKAAFDEITQKLRAAGYDHAFHDDVVDMQGIAVSALVTGEIRVPDPVCISRVNGHQLKITLTHLLHPSVLPGIKNDQAAMYQVMCIDCDTMLDEGTRKPLEVAQRHIVNRPLGWPDGLDWNNTGAWAVIMLIAGAEDASGGERWRIYPSFSVSRWETREHAERHAAARCKEGVAKTAVIEWGDDLKEDLATNARVLAALSLT